MMLMDSSAGLPARHIAAIRWVALLLALGVILFLPGQASAEEAEFGAPLCRFGVNVHVTSEVSGIADFDVAQLRAGRYIDYRARSEPSHPEGMHYIPVVRLNQTANGYEYSPSGQALEEMILGNPGSPIYIGNEPDRRIFQDDIEPDVYATAYHDLYALIKEVDPTMQVFPASIVQATELRLKYMDMILAAYKAQYGKPMPVDGWSIHGFILNEKKGEWGADIPPGLNDTQGMVISVQQTDDIDIFTANIQRFRAWMHTNGYRDTPLFLSEYGSLMPDLDYLCNPDGTQCFTAERVNEFMNETFDYLLTATDAKVGFPADDNRLVQHFSWYSTNDKGFNGYLFDQDEANALSSMGENYASYTAALADEIDFRVVNVQLSPAAPPINGGPVDFSVSAEIANSGNLQSESQATVTFYHGDPDNGGTQLGAAQTVDLTGCGDRVQARFTWTNIDSGFNGERVYAKVTVNNDTDTDASNNVGSAKVFFAKAYVYLPQID